MRLIQTQLRETLIEKINILLDLTEGQERMKEFLIKPTWSEYFDLLTPQEELLKKLQANVQRQRMLTSKLAQAFGLPVQTGAIQVLKLLPDAERDELIPLFEASRKEACKLRSCSNLSQRLLDAQNEHTYSWLESWQKRSVPSISLYNSFGHHVHKPAISVFRQEA